MDGMTGKIDIRDARSADAPSVVSLVREMAEEDGETSPITETSVQAHLRDSGSGIVLAESDGRIIGLLSFSLRPSVYHAAPACLVEMLFVRRDSRRRGAGGSLMERMLSKAGASGCAEISVSVMPGNDGAVRFYRRHGLTEEVMSLEKHFKRTPGG